MFLNQVTLEIITGSIMLKVNIKSKKKKKQIKETEGRVEIQQEAVCWELQHQRIG